jgi:Carboxypeptidase regulatory-like domain
MSWRFSAAIALSLFLVVPSVFGQAEITGRIAGVVTDASGAMIPGVTVAVEGPTLFSPRTVLSAEDASYFIDKLPPGTYKVTYTFPGFKTVERADVAPPFRRGGKCVFMRRVKAPMDLPCPS